MANKSLNRLLWNFLVRDSPLKKRRELCQGVLYNVIKRFQSRLPESDKELEDSNKAPELETRRQIESGIDSDSSGDEDTSDGKWKLDLAWLTRALEPATQLRRWALPTGEKSQPGSRSLSEIIASIQKNKHPCLPLRTSRGSSCLGIHGL
ncbi:hypothetical protein Bca52824_092988 [Brassica carinata]|uniref:Uncharacterized protein n=1 Tax=Brassica carinata TaxID=52824 RepID=A0A8X7P5D0_BRACI|nr:hypothetical protein Bca52824_092988 [Brassica carinata]